MVERDESKRTCPFSHGGGGAAPRAERFRVLGCPLPKWARWPVLGAFLFFLVKGLVWLAVFAGAWKAFGE